MIEYVLCVPQIDEFQFVIINNKNNKWNFPGGKIESGEKPVDACIREFMEETGFLHLDWNNIGEFGNDTFKVHVFHALKYEFDECRTQLNEAEVRILDTWERNDLQTVDEYVSLIIVMLKHFPFVKYFNLTHQD